MEFAFIDIFLWIMLPYLIIVTAYFLIILRSLRKLQMRITEIESKLVKKVEKETVEKEKNREQKLLRLKSEIDEMLHDSNR